MSEEKEYQDFEDMKVWQDAQDLAVDVYQDFTGIRDYSFCDQIKRAAVSISNNVAEGSERLSAKDFARYLDVSKGSSGEVRSMYCLAERLKFVDEATSNKRKGQCKLISRQLGGFAKRLREK